MFDLAQLAAAGWLKQVDFHESICSTSDRALELAAQDNASLPLLVLAERQTGGRGRGTNRWWADEGALTFSLAMEAPRARLPLAERPRLSLVAGLAVCEALANLVPLADCRVKWPNDVYASGGKICGILCESVPGWKDRLVVGIGINVNNSLTQVPADVRQRGRSLVDFAGGHFNRNDVLLRVLDRFERRWTKLLGGKFTALATAYRERCLLSGRTVTAMSGGRSLVGMCCGIDDGGALVLQTESGPWAMLSGTIEAWE